MEAVFLKILNMSITAGWAALAVMAARLLFRKAPRGLLCCLWAVVTLRLVLPFSLESIISLIPSTETLHQEFLFAAVPQIDSGITVVIENGTIHVDGREPVPVSLYWQEECPMPDDILEEFHEFYGELGMLPFLLDGTCRYQHVDSIYFLMEREGTIYLVSRWAQDKGLNAIWYIIELHRT